MRTWPLALVLVAGAAAAAPPSAAPQTVAVPAPEPAAASTPTGVDARARRPGAERGYIFASALTPPAGTVEVDLRALTAGLGVLDVEAGITGTTELSAEAGLIPENGNTLATEIEQVFAHTDRVRVAVLGTLRQVNQQQVYNAPVAVDGGPMPLVTPFDTGQATNLLGLGGVGTACLDAPCQLEVTAGAQALIPLGGGSAVGVGWGDLSVGNQSIRAVGELITIGDQGAVGLLGLRGAWTHVSLDGAVTIVPTGTDTSAPMIYVGLGVRP